MQKTQIKAKKDKKKNTETGLLMGQNINVFSQLSASYLTAKSNTTQQQQHFVKQTQIIEYHDQNINRIISLLRKKAEVTKVKAVLQLKETISAMKEVQIEDFMATFANLFQQIIINEQSKQVYEEFIEIAGFIVENYKKCALKQISTLFPSLLLSMKLGRVNKLLFTGSEQDMGQKGFLLLSKKEVRKKFVLVSRLILQTEQVHLINQSNYQRNIHQYTKALKEMLNIYLNHSKRNQLREQTLLMVRDICELLQGKSVDEYFKVGGKGKASLIELYEFFVYFYSNEPLADIPWKKMTKIVSQYFLDKDPIVQTTLWKICNKGLLASLKKIALSEERKDSFQLYNQNLLKCEEKLLECLKLGGLSMYKGLPSYFKEHQSFTFSNTDTHKSIVQKVSFMRKFAQELLSQEDENEARIQCYYNIACHIILVTNELKSNLLNEIIAREGQNAEDSKKMKEIRSLIDKAKSELASNLQKKYYTEPPTSKNSFSYYIPQYFSKLLNTFSDQIKVVPFFNEKHTFSLYRDINISSPLLQNIFSNCEKNLSLLLNFYQNWPETDKEVNLDMTEANQEYEKTARIYLLSNRRRATNKAVWFDPSWDLRKSAIIYDPRLTSKDIEQQPEQGSSGLNIEWTPINKQLQQNYMIPELDEARFQFFLKLLSSDEVQTQSLKYFLSYFFTHLITSETVSTLLERFLLKANQLTKGQFLVGEREIGFLKIVVHSFNIYLLRHQKKISEQLLVKFKPYFASIGGFLKLLHNYKLDQELIFILKQLNQLLRIQQYESQLLQTLQSILKDTLTQLNRPAQSQNLEKEERLRKNKLKRINEFVENAVWYLLKSNSQNYQLVVLELFDQKALWMNSESKIEPWAITFAILDKCAGDALSKISQKLVGDFDSYLTTISLLLSCHLMLPLQIHPEYKKAYGRLQQELVREFSNLSIQRQLNNIEKLVTYQYQQGLLTESLGLRNILKSTLRYYQNYSLEDITLLSKIVERSVILKLVNERQNDPKLNIKSIIATNVLSEIPLQDMNVSLETSFLTVLEILQNQVKNLESHFQKFLSIAQLSSCLWKTSVGQEVLTRWEQKKIVESLLNRLIPSSIHQIQLPITYHSYVLFSTINALYPVFGIDLIQPFLQTTLKIFWHRKQNERDNELYIFKQEERIKFINRAFLDLTKEINSKIIIDLPLEALEQYTHYEKFLFELDQQQDQEQVQLTQKSIQNLFIQYSELLMKITTYINIGQTGTLPDESTLIKLLQCPFPGIKKTSFILLKQLYDLQLVKPSIPQIYIELLTFNLKNQHQIQDYSTANLIYNFLYTWMALVSRRKAIQIVRNQDEEQFTLQQYIQSNGLSELFLGNVFMVIADKIDYLKNEAQFSLTVDELLMDEFNLNVEEETFIEHKLFTLSSKALFYYAINFPLFLRNFMDKSKKYRSVCEKLLRNYISEAIFAKEVSMIEIKEPEWKANGNLEIYVVKKNKQIYAEYQHDVIRIGLRLVMRSNYPLTPIHIEFGQGLKMEEGSKWALMLQSQLHSKNNSIINGILLWKQNIDKKLSGIQECAICYDIVDPKGHLPKKGCKTCKKKFHSNCIMKWFSKSNKSQCPLCKSQFL